MYVVLVLPKNNFIICVKFGLLEFIGMDYQLHTYCYITLEILGGGAEGSKNYGDSIGNGAG